MATAREPEVVFIGGTGRCGTSILRTVLGEHDACAVLPFEHRFLIDPDGIVEFLNGAGENWSPYTHDRRLKRLHRFLMTLSGTDCDNPLPAPGLYDGWSLSTHFPGFEAAVNRLMERLIAFRFKARWVGSATREDDELWSAPAPTRESLVAPLRAFCYETITSLLSANGTRVHVEDNTFNLLHAPALHALFPGARFIHMVRHPADVVASFRRQRWCPDDLGNAAAFYAGIMDRILDQTAHLPETALATIRLDQFAANPESIVARLDQWIGLDYSRRAIETVIRPQPAGTGASAAERAALGDVLAPYLERFGFEG